MPDQAWHDFEPMQLLLMDVGGKFFIWYLVLSIQGEGGGIKLFLKGNL